MQTNISSSSDSSTPSSTLSPTILHNPWLNQIHKFYKFLFNCDSYTYITHFRRIGMGTRTAKKIISLIQLIHSKGKINFTDDGYSTRIYFCDPPLHTPDPVLLFPSGRRSIVQRVTAFYSLLEFQPQPVFLSHFKKIQMKGDSTRRLLYIILFVQIQPLIIIKRFDRLTKIRLETLNVISYGENIS